MNTQKAMDILEYYFAGPYDVGEAIDAINDVINERDVLITVLKDANQLHSEVRNERDKLRKACKTIADVVRWPDIGVSLAGRPDDDQVPLHFTVGQIRQARAALRDAGVEVGD